MQQSPLCYAALEYIHSLIGAREEKRGKQCEKEGEGLKTIPLSEMTSTPSFSSFGHVLLASPARRALSVEDRNPRQGLTKPRRSGRHRGHRWPSGLPGKYGRGRSALQARPRSSAGLYATNAFP